MKSAIWLLVFLAIMELAAPSAPPAGTSASAASPGALAPAPAPNTGALAPSPAPINPTAASPNAAVGAPALASSSSLNAAAITNGLAGFGFTNQFGTNFTSGNLASVLLHLQVSLQQTAALLANFNNGLSTVPATASTSGGAGNLAQNLAGGGGANLSQNLAQSVAVPTTSVSPPATPASVFAPLGAAPVPSGALAAPVTSSTNISGVPVTPAGSNTFTGSLASSDSVQLLSNLQQSMQQLLSQIAAATGTPVNGTIVTNDSSAMTGTPRIPARTSAPRTLTPKGR